jgi:Protein of unknown function (DUF1091)
VLIHEEIFPLTSKFEPQVSAYLDVILDRVECSGDPDFLECSNLKIKRVSKERLMFGNFTMVIPMDNEVIADLAAYQKQGGEYRKMPYKIVKPFCDIVKEDTYFYDDLCINSTIPKERLCPFPAGTYFFNGFTPSLANLPTAIIPSGDYRLHFVLKKGLEEKFLAVFTASIVQL